MLNALDPRAAHLSQGGGAVGCAAARAATRSACTRRRLSPSPRSRAASRASAAATASDAFLHPHVDTNVTHRNTFAL
jgi:hypothetical protein